MAIPITFTTIPAAIHELGWRFDGKLPEVARIPMGEFAAEGAIARSFSPPRSVALAEFQIATCAVPFSDLMGDPYDLCEISTVEALCELVDAKLAVSDLRLPTEDELEAACGGSLFFWGMTVPDGIPYGSETSFRGHKEPNAFGLTLNSNPYRVELVRHAFKLGDGGRSLCGGEPWPLAWLSLSPCFRMRNEDVEDCFIETLEEALIRPIRSLR